MTEEEGRNKHYLSQIELGEWFSNAEYYYRPRNDNERNLMHNSYEEGYNNGFSKGLLEGKPKWHDLRKDPNNLPKHDTDDEENNFYLVAFRNYFNHEEIIVREFLWSGAEFREENNSEIPYFKEEGILVAWCELLKFEE